MNALALVNTVLKELRQPTVTTLVGANQYTQNVLSALNAIAEEQAAAHVWPALEKVQQITMVQGTQSYNLAADFGKILGPPYMNSPSMRMLPILGAREWSAETLGDTRQGTPFVCHLEAGKLWLWYVPDAVHDSKTLLLRYQKRPTALSLDNDTTELADGILIAGAIARVKMMDGDVTPADIERYRLEAHTQLVETARQTPRFVRYRDF